MTTHDFGNQTDPPTTAVAKRNKLRTTVNEIRTAVEVPPLMRKPARIYLDGFCDGIAFVLDELRDGDAHSYDFQFVKGFADGVFHARTELGLKPEDL